MSIRRFLICLSEYFLHFEFICHRTGVGVKRSVQIFAAPSHIVAGYRQGSGSRMMTSWSGLKIGASQR
jgi:hypothetical protein